MTASDIRFSPKGLYIGGEWVDSVQGKKFSTINPSNCKLLGEVPLADGEDVNRSVKAAKKHSKTGVVPIKERAGFLVSLAGSLGEL